MSLRELGLTERQEQIYRSLIVDPEVTVEGLSRRLELDAAAIGTALVELTELALVVDDDDAPSGARARRPGIALNELAQANAQRLTRRLRSLAACQDDILAMDELARVPSGAVRDDRSPATGAIEIVEGVAAVRRRLDELVYLTTRSVDSVLPSESRPKEVYETARPKNLLSLRRGVTCRSVVSRAHLTRDLEAHYMLMSMQAGTQVRMTDDAVDRMLVLDNTTVVVPIVPGDRDSGAFIVRHPGLVRGYRELFARQWRSARPLEASRDALDAAVAGAVDADGRALLSMLATGVSDETAARSLAVSPRQFRRRMTATVSMLDATGRFQAGVLAERYGLIDEV